MQLSLSDITLNKWIEYTNAIQPLDKEYADIDSQPKHRRDVLRTGNNVKRAYFTYAFFADAEYADVRKNVFVDDVMAWYNEVFGKLFEGTERYESVEVWTLRHPVLTPTNPITFGEFIDAKMIAQASEGRNKWELLQYICAIFLRKPGEQYNPEFIEETSERFILMGELRMPVVMKVASFFEALNEYALNNFTVFQEGDGEDSGGHMKAHMERWGWINFLKTIAKTKAFDIQGSNMNSIDCVRQTNACEVLTWASEEKDYNVAHAADMEERMRK